MPLGERKTYWCCVNQVCKGSYVTCRVFRVQVFLALWGFRLLGFGPFRVLGFGSSCPWFPEVLGLLYFPVLGFRLLACDMCWLCAKLGS